MHRRSYVFRKCVIIVIVSLSVSSGFTRKPSSYIDLCDQHDPKIEECLKNAAEQIRPHLSKGIAEFGIPPLGPLIFPIAEFQSGASFRVAFKNITVYDLDKFEIDQITMDIPHNHVDFKVKFQAIRIEAMYELDGTVLVLRLQGAGLTTLNMQNASADFTLEGSRFMKGGKEYLKWDKKDYILDLGKTTFYLYDLFADDQDLTEKTNKALNDNGDAFIEELRPLMDQSVSKVILAVFDKVFARYALNELFLGL